MYHPRWTADSGPACARGGPGALTSAAATGEHDGFTDSDDESGREACQSTRHAMERTVMLEQVTPRTVSLAL